MKYSIAVRGGKSIKRAYYLAGDGKIHIPSFFVQQPGDRPSASAEQGQNRLVFEQDQRADVDARTYHDGQPGRADRPPVQLFDQPGQG